MIFEALYIALAFFTIWLTWRIFTSTRSWRTALTYTLIADKVILTFATVAGVNKELFKVIINKKLSLTVGINELVILSLLAANIAVNWQYITRWL